MKSKKQPTREDLAAAFSTIRDQYQIIRVLNERLRRKDQVLATVLMAYPRLEELRVNSFSIPYWLSLCAFKARKSDCYGLFQSVIDFNSSMMSFNLRARLM